MAFRDLEESIPALFDELRRDGANDYGSLRIDTWTSRDFAHEANYIAAARLAPGITRWHCPNCGEEMESRPGSRRPIHMGRYGICPMSMRPLPVVAL
jgi:predicted RNA-binding Zn-ribbon protein involved in translation (DUF1610 family)